MLSFVKECYSNVQQTISAVQGDDIVQLEQISQKCRNEAGEGAVKFAALIVKNQVGNFVESQVTDGDSVLDIFHDYVTVPYMALTGVCTVVNGICSVVSGMAVTQQKLLANPALVSKLHSDISGEEKRQILAQLNI